MRYMLPLVVLAACAAPKAWDDMTPEERQTYLAFRQQELQDYIDFARAQADKFVEAGTWKVEDVELAFALAEEANRLYHALKAADGGTLEQQLAARSAMRKAILKFIDLGVDRFVKDPPTAATPGTD